MSIHRSAKGKAKTKNHEGFRSFVYDDHVSVYPKVALKPGQIPKGYATTGYGFNVGKSHWWDHPLAREALEGKMTTVRADAVFEIINHAFELQVEGIVQDRVENMMTQDMKDELLDFIFNTGFGKFARSTCLQVLNLVQQPADFHAVGAQIKRWVHDDHGNELAALVERRGHNAEPFLKAV